MRILTFPHFVSLLIGTLISASHGFQTTIGSTRLATTVPTILRPRARNDWNRKCNRKSVACHIASLRDETNNVPSNPKDSSLSGLGILFTVPIAWGTYNPVVKYLYTLEHPVPGLVFSVGYFWVGATTLWILQAILGNQNKDSSVVGADGDVVASTVADESSGASRALQWQCGFELGTYLFMGAMLQVWGLRTVPADRAAFLVQLTTVIVPFLEYFMAGKKLSRTTIMASILAFVGVVLIEMEGATENLFSSETLLSGDPTDLLFLLAAVFYSLHVVRLGHYAPKLEPLQLAKSKATAQGVLSTAFLASLLWVFPTENPVTMEVVDFFDNYSLSAGLPAAAVAGILWMGWSTGSWAIFAQSLGQKLVSSPTTANMVYSLQPLFTAIFAYILLGEEMSGLMGGSCILGAVCMVGNQQRNDAGASNAIKQLQQQQPRLVLPTGKDMPVERRLTKTTIH